MSLRAEVEAAKKQAATAQATADEAQRHKIEGELQAKALEEAAAQARAEAEAQARARAAAEQAARAEAVAIEVAMSLLKDAMEEEARSRGRSKHPLSNVEGLHPGNQEITYKTDTRVEFSRLYSVHLIGGIIGSNTFEVGVSVRGQLTKSGNEWNGSVVDSYVVYDQKK